MDKPAVIFRFMYMRLTMAVNPEAVETQLQWINDDKIYQADDTGNSINH